MLKATVQRLVVHSAAHLLGEAAAVGDIIPHPHGIVIVIESIGHCIHILLGLFSPYPIQFTEARVEHQPAMAWQPELGAVLACDEPRPLLALVSLRLELIDAFIED